MPCQECKACQRVEGGYHAVCQPMPAGLSRAPGAAACHTSRTGPSPVTTCPHAERLQPVSLHPSSVKSLLKKAYIIQPDPVKIDASKLQVE